MVSAPELLTVSAPGSESELSTVSAPELLTGSESAWVSESELSTVLAPGSESPTVSAPGSAWFQKA